MSCSWLVLCIIVMLFVFFFFKQKTAYEMRISDWSSDVCSSDLLTNKAGTDNPVTLLTANEVLGGSSTSRLIMDLRETKGWAYYAGSALPGVKETIPLLVYAPVQTDKTGESIDRKSVV